MVVRSRISLLVPVLVFLLCGCGAAAPRGGDPPDLDDDSECKTFQTDIDVVWNQKVEQDVEAVFARVGGSYANKSVYSVRTHMDRISEDWVRLNEQACVDWKQREMPDRVYHLKRACFDAALLELRTLVTQLKHAGPQTVQKAPETVADFGVKECVVSAVFQAYGADVPGSGSGGGGGGGRVDAVAREAKELTARAKVERKLGDPAKALELAEQARGRAKEAGNARLEAEAHVQYGAAAEMLGNYDQARPAFERALQLAQAAGDDRARATALHGLGTLDMHAGRFEQALEHHRRGLTIRRELARTEQAAPELRAAVGTSHKELARVLRRQGRTDEALAQLREALRIHREARGKAAHPEIATDLYDIGVVLSAAGRFERAVDHFEQAARMDASLLGKHHPDYADDLSGLGVALMHAGRRDEASSKLEQALTIHREALGDLHPSVAADHFFLGQFYATGEQWDEALAHYEQALALHQRLADEKGHSNHAERAEGLYYIALVALELEDPDRAGVSARKAAKVLEGAPERTRRIEQMQKKVDALIAQVDASEG